MASEEAKRASVQRAHGISGVAKTPWKARARARQNLLVRAGKHRAAISNNLRFELVNGNPRGVSVALRATPFGALTQIETAIG